MAGLFAAILLRSRGWDAHVYERAGEALANRGAGIATHNALYDAVRSAGIELRDEMGVASRGRVVFDASGAVIGKLDMPQIMTSWGLIYRFLRAQIPDAQYHHGHALVGLEPSSKGIRAVFDNGTRAVGDWLIGADGSRSTVRRLVAPEVGCDYCGYFVWRGLFDEDRIDPPVLAQVADRLALNMAPGGHWLGYLVAGPEDVVEPGQRWYNWGWYRTAGPDRYREHLTDAGGTFHENGIPHDLIRRHFVDAMREEARRSLAPQIQSIIGATPQPFLQGIYDLGCERLVHDGVVLIGDAAFTARPHVGMGVSKAAEDAAALAPALGDQGRMARWERERIRYGRAVLEWSRDLGSYCGPDPRDEAARAKARRHQRPEVLMAETAASDPSPYLARYRPRTV